MQNKNRAVEASDTRYSLNFVIEFQQAVESSEITRDIISKFNITAVAEEQKLEIAQQIKSQRQLR